MIKAVLVDVDDTLLDFDESAKLSMQMAAAEKGIQLPGNIWDIFVQINEGLWHMACRPVGIITKERRQKWLKMPIISWILCSKSRKSCDNRLETNSYS